MLLSTVLVIGATHSEWQLHQVNPLHNMIVAVILQDPSVFSPCRFLTSYKNVNRNKPSSLPGVL